MHIITAFRVHRLSILLITSYEYEFRINKKKCKNYNNYEVRKYIIYLCVCDSSY